MLYNAFPPVSFKSFTKEELLSGLLPHPSYLSRQFEAKNCDLWSLLPTTTPNAGSLGQRPGLT